MTWLLPLAVTVIAYAVAYDRHIRSKPEFSFGAVDIFRIIGAIIYFGAATAITLAAWIGWLAWKAFA